MKSPLLFIIMVICILTFSYVGYLSWKKPKSYFDLYRKGRGNIKKRYPYLPQVLAYNFFQKFPTVDLWSARIIIVVGLLIAFIGLIVSIGFPLVK